MKGSHVIFNHVQRNVDFVFSLQLSNGFFPSSTKSFQQITHPHTHTWSECLYLLFPFAFEHIMEHYSLWWKANAYGETLLGYSNRTQTYLNLTELNVYEP